MRIWAGRACGVAVLTLTGLVAACAPGSDSTQSEPDLGPVPTVRSAADLALPLDSYRLSQKEYLTVRRAAWRLIRDCVRRFGGEYTVAEGSVVSDVPALLFTNQRRYGLFDASSAAALGYNLPPDQLPPAGDKNDDKGGGGGGWNPSETEKLLVRGIPEGSANAPTDTEGKPLPADGCMGEADRLLAQGAARPSDENLANQLSVEMFKRTERDSRVRDAMTNWSRCMKEAGYPYQTIWEPNDREWPDPAGDEEIATATADVGCKRRAHLVEIYFQVETAYQKRVIEQRAQSLKLAQDFARTTARNAARIVGGA